ncbi:unnamed protein product [Dibothriocephalus latus]|uniref:Uncharacterized protein n=1 Tax=Dibothriocephalus latus TaxID=60516 RepID=A0A3P7LBA6_DIBLA|nr:unnamed protein product [Dibothriocephalus latus]
MECLSANPTVIAGTMPADRDSLVPEIGVQGASTGLMICFIRAGINECHPGFSCKRIDEVFTSAQDFCEQVWDGTWKVVPDSKHVWLDKDPQCLHFVGEDVASHNKLVAEHRAKMILDNLADVADKGIGTP